MRLLPSRLRRIAAQSRQQRGPFSDSKQTKPPPGLACPAAFRQAFVIPVYPAASLPVSFRLGLSCDLNDQATPLIKTRLLRQRACNEKNEKGKICAGHLKRWFTIQEGWINRFGPNAELYRCEKCKTIYLPNPAESPRTATLAW